MSINKLPELTYDDGRTKQSFKDETDINKILLRAQATGTISHLNKHEAMYGDFADFDFFEQQLKITKGREIFDDLPAEIRREFHNSHIDFFKFVNDPKNVDRLGKLLPALAAPGNQLLDVSGKTEPRETPAPEARTNQPTGDTPAATPETPPAAPQAADTPPAQPS